MVRAPHLFATHLAADATCTVERLAAPGRHGAAYAAAEQLTVRWTPRTERTVDASEGNATDIVSAGTVEVLDAAVDVIPVASKVTIDGTAYTVTDATVIVDRDGTRVMQRLKVV